MAVSCAPWVHSGVEALKPPAFQFYASDFLAGVSNFNLQQRGLYITLLCLQWDHGFVTQEEIDAICYGHAIATPLQKHVLAKFKQGQDGHFINERLEHERQKQADFKAGLSKAGKHGAKQRWLGHSHPMARLKRGNASPSPSPSPLKERKKSFEKPTIEQVRLLGSKSGLPELESDKFFYHYDSKGWKVGREPMLSLESAMGGWVTRWRAAGGNQSTPASIASLPLNSKGIPEPPFQ